ncbi:glycerol-3-phosphate 1-O-acyltransferase PlsY [Tichowtungia aerotolerans]|uniref:Glycerol-3-phosphate acyltransferase n=1 Tax=Tichowtungia aerotolerans TaxID=2697043 RepID=A0A6P1MBS9_9BACT|nr:glycerol-3-phosphate 1-O-acyltransferase PlsY [Tichowtungia aerotolerans]QHI68555.1 glycerol-3-phosphate 1-O-acyltransferase PlsY [Tichowtungia aerotolerans]
MQIQIPLLTILAYLIGSVPFGLLLAKTQGKDIRKLGSGNIGATNVLRCLGKPLGITCFVLDVLKGFLPAFLFPNIGNCGAEFGILFGAAAILGHNFPIFLKFKGGKGVATSAGVLFGVAPMAVVAGLLVWVIVLKVSGYVSLGSIIAALAVALIGWIRVDHYGVVTAAALTLLAALSIYRHRANIQRLIAGTENKFEKKKKS